MRIMRLKDTLNGLAGTVQPTPAVSWVLRNYPFIFSSNIPKIFFCD
jgi:hypothetical protein